MSERWGHHKLDTTPQLQGFAQRIAAGDVDLIGPGTHPDIAAAAAELGVLPWFILIRLYKYKDGLF